MEVAMQDNNLLDNEEELDDFDDEGTFITLIDDDGKETSFEVLDYFNFNGKDYAVVLPYEETEEEVVIFEVKHNDNDENSDEYVPLENEDTMFAVFEEFKKRNADNFNFED
ncbi:MAG: DUF1292 domain-containing protein [Ruminococcus sp.]|nr:DUF1292 domain-containing protein [Ruminococcus sp.]